MAAKPKDIVNAFENLIDKVRDQVAEKRSRGPSVRLAEALEPANCKPPSCV